MLCKGESSWRVNRGSGRLMPQSARKNRARARRREIMVALHKVPTTAVDGMRIVGRALDVLIVYDRLGSDIIGLQEVRRCGHLAFIQAGHLVYCRAVSGVVGQVVKGLITRGIHRSYQCRLHLNCVAKQRP